MAVANITFDYGQILALARQLPPDERKQLGNELLREPETDAWTKFFDLFPKTDELTDEEILEECKIVREQRFRKNKKPASTVKQVSKPMRAVIDTNVWSFRQR